MGIAGACAYRAVSKRRRGAFACAYYGDIVHLASDDCPKNDKRKPIAQSLALLRCGQSLEHRDY